MGAPAVASVGASVWARTKSFERGMKRSRKSVWMLRRGLGSTIKRLAGFGSALTAVAAGGGLAIMIKRSISSIDALAKLSDRIGTTTEQLIGLQHAAEITGAGADLMAKSLDVMSKRLGEAAMGTGEAKSAIQELGLDVNKLMAMDPAAAFRKIAEKMSHLGTQAEKAAIASKIFSRAGLQLVNTLDLGAAGLDAMQKEAVELGLAFNRIDAAKVEEANDAITRLKASFQGLANIVSIQIAKPLKALADGVTGWVKNIDKAKLRELLKKIAVSVGFLGDAFLIAGGLVQGMRAALVDLLVPLRTIAGLVTQLGKGLTSNKLEGAFLSGFGGGPGFPFAPGTGGNDRPGTTQFRVGGELGALFDWLKNLVSGVPGGMKGASQSVDNFNQAMDETRASAAAAAKELVAAGFSGKVSDFIAGMFDDAVSLFSGGGKDGGRKIRQQPVDPAIAMRELAGGAAEAMRKSMRTGREIIGDELFALSELMQTGALDLVTYRRKIVELNERLMDVSGITAMVESAKSAAAELKKSAAEITKNMRTPSEVFRDFARLIARMLNVGDITQETFDRAFDKAAKETQDASGQQGNLARTFAGGEELSRFRRIGSSKATIQKVSDPQLLAETKGLRQDVGNLDFSRLPK